MTEKIKSFRSECLKIQAKTLLWWVLFNTTETNDQNDSANDEKCQRKKTAPN